MYKEAKPFALCGQNLESSVHVLSKVPCLDHMVLKHERTVLSKNMII